MSECQTHHSHCYFQCPGQPCVPHRYSGWWPLHLDADLTQPVWIKNFLNKRNSKCLKTKFVQLPWFSKSVLFEGRKQRYYIQCSSFAKFHHCMTKKSGKPKFSLQVHLKISLIETILWVNHDGFLRNVIEIYNQWQSLPLKLLFKPNPSLSPGTPENLHK